MYDLKRRRRVTDREFKCGGGDPCERCVKLMSLEPKICPKPCVKAQFLDIIEAGSIFSGESNISCHMNEHISLD